MRYLTFVVALALLPTMVAAESTDVDAQGRQTAAVLSEKDLDSIHAGGNVHIHPNEAVDVSADGLGLPDAAGVAAEASPVVADHS